jgi:hypothetical protein
MFTTFRICFYYGVIPLCQLFFSVCMITFWKKKVLCENEFCDYIFQPYTGQVWVARSKSTTSSNRTPPKAGFPHRTQVRSECRGQIWFSHILCTIYCIEYKIAEKPGSAAAAMSTQFTPHDLAVLLQNISTATFIQHQMTMKQQVSGRDCISSTG